MRYQGLMLTYHGISFYSRMFRYIFKECGGSENKLPQNSRMKQRLAHMDNGPLLLFTLTPFVKGSRKQRVFVDCPECGMKVPAGRLAQHIGTGTCKS